MDLLKVRTADRFREILTCSCLPGEVKIAAFMQMKNVQFWPYQFRWFRPHRHLPSRIERRCWYVAAQQDASHGANVELARRGERVGAAGCAFRQGIARNKKDGAAKVHTRSPGNASCAIIRLP